MGCTLTTGNTGSQYCADGSALGDPVGIILTTKGYSMSAADFLDHDKWNVAINANSVFPIMDIVGLTDNSTEPTYIDYPNDKRKLSRQGKYRFAVDLDLNDVQKRNMLKFRGFAGDMFFVYLNGIIRGRSLDGGDTVEGIRVEQLNVRKEKLNAIGEASMVTLDVDLKSETDLNKFDYAMEVDWDVTELDGLTEVDLTVSSPTATSIVVKVTSSAYGNDNPIMGIAFLDFDISNLSGAATSVDNGDGTYTISGTGMVTGAINLKTPPLMDTKDLLIISTGPAIVTI